MIYCFDLDGTLCTKTTDGNYNNAQPLPDRIKKVNKLYDAGHKIIIETARGSKTGICWGNFTCIQLKKWGVKYHTMRTGIKMDADVYVDDKGINADDYFNKFLN